MRKHKPFASADVEPAWVANTRHGRELAVYGNHDQAAALCMMDAALPLPPINKGVLAAATGPDEVDHGTLRWDTAARVVVLQDGRIAPGA
jgi:hypothetical protein